MRAIYRFVLVAMVAAVGLPRLGSGQIPGGHERWMGTWEEPSGKAEVYDFRFYPGGDVAVQKSTGIELRTQTFEWSRVGADLRLSGDTAGAVPELAGATLKSAGENRFQLALSDAQVITIRRSFTALSWLHLLFLFGVLFVGNELCRRYKPAAYVMFFVLPIVLIPVFLHSGFDGVFRWTKLYSAVAGAAFFTLFRFNGLDRYRWAKAAVAFILAINIFEACTQDYSTGHLPSLLNAAAGILNILTISRWMGIHRDDAPPHDMLWPGMTIGWIIAYDIWNVTFVYLNFPNTAAFTAFATLLAPTLAALFVKKGTWMQARAYTLAIYMTYIFSFKALADNVLNIQLAVPLPRSGAIALGLALLSLGSNIGYALLHYRWRVTGRAPAYLQVGQSVSVI